MFVLPCVLVLAAITLPACVDAPDDSADPSQDTDEDGSAAEPDDPVELAAQALAPGCKKMIRVVLRTNYGIETFDPTRRDTNGYPNHCWMDDEPATPGLQVQNMNGPDWHRCRADGCGPTLGKTHWYYDDTSMFTNAQDHADIARVHAGMGDIKGTVDMANRGAGWNYFQMDAKGATNIINRWFAETHAASGDHFGCQFQENDYIDEWLQFQHAKGDVRIRPQLVVISADHVCSNGGHPTENCAAAYTQIKHACSLIGSGRSIGITAEGGLKLQYGHCLGDVVKAINECTCKTKGGCF
jgi:hypothetical protein